MLERKRLRAVSRRVWLLASPEPLPSPYDPLFRCFCRAASGTAGVTLVRGLGPLTLQPPRWCSQHAELGGDVRVGGWSLEPAEPGPD